MSSPNLTVFLLPLLIGSSLFAQQVSVPEHDRFGVPDGLLKQHETYSAQFAADVLASLPEGRSVLNVRPELVSAATERNLALVEDAEVEVSFVHEGAGYRNVAGMFVFDTDSPPTAADFVHQVMFPNASFYGSGGLLRQGDTVNLGTIPAGKSIGFFLFANGFRNGGVTTGQWTVYTVDALNPSGLRQTILLQDPDDGRFVLGFEDIRRDRGGDQDFNDLILSVRVTPGDAVQQGGIPALADAVDVDGDGVENTRDDYPDDASRAFRVRTPAADWGTLAFEDLWPVRGDFDFNDLVCGWQTEEARDAQGRTVDLTCRYQVLAVGASYHNGLRLRLPIAPDKVASVTRQFDSFDPVPHSLQAGESFATTEVFADAWLMIQRSPGSLFANSDRATPRQAGREVTVRFTFAQPLAPGALGEAPYDVFLKREGVEVHRPGFPAGESIDAALLGTGDDATDEATGHTFKTPWGQPWVLTIAGPWQHPAEKTSIERAYPRFVRWAQSAGLDERDWYLHRESTAVYAE